MSDSDDIFILQVFFLNALHKWICTLRTALRTLKKKKNSEHSNLFLDKITIETAKFQTQCRFSSHAFKYYCPTKCLYILRMIWIFITSNLPLVILNRTQFFLSNYNFIISEAKVKLFFFLNSFYFLITINLNVKICENNIFDL